MLIWFCDVAICDEQPSVVQAMIRFVNPMSLPPIVIVTRFVSDVTELTWLLMMSGVWAPEQATKVSA